MSEASLEPFGSLLNATSPEAPDDVLIAAWAGHPVVEANAAHSPAIARNRTNPTRDDPEAAINRTGSHRASIVSSPTTISRSVSLHCRQPSRPRRRRFESAQLHSAD